MLNIDRFCVACLQHFNDTQELIKHTPTHNKFICTECGITFSTFEDQKTHEENSHGPNEIFEQEKN